MTAKPRRRAPTSVLTAALWCAGAAHLAAVETASPISVEERAVATLDGRSIRATFGRLTVPEVRSDPDSAHIELAFVRLHSEAAEPRAPLVYLAGGPGGSSTWQAEVPEFLSHWTGALEVGDVILLDQRGTGRSQPDMRYRWEGEPPIRAFASEEVALGHFMEMSRRARQALIERGIDPRGYTSVESADDVEGLRRALGVERISLLGFSYGTHLALTIIRRHGEHVENAILVGTEGPAHTWKPPLNLDVAFGKLALMVAADERLGPRVPDLVALLDRVLAQLEAEPMAVPVEGAEGEVFELPIGAWGLKLILRRDIGDASDLPVFPRLLHSIDRGDPSILRWFAQKRAGGAIGINGMSMLVDGASAASPARLAMIEEQIGSSRFGRVVNFPFPDVNAVWRPRDVGDEYRGPLVSGVRTLFLSGTLDWNAPPQQAEELRWGFPNATHLVVENAGHEQILPHPEAQRAVVRFLRGEDVSDMHIAWPRLRFVPLEGSDPKVTHPSVEER